MDNVKFGDSRLPDRFWAKCRPDPSGCWVWIAYLSKSGYGQFHVNGIPRPAHRVAYGSLVAPVDELLHCDHLCRNRSCVNPAHIEPVTCKENIRRGDCRAVRMAEKQERTHCKRGHEMTPENTYVKHWARPNRLSSSGTVLCCRQCKAEQARIDYERALARGKRVIKTAPRLPRDAAGKIASDTQ